MPGFPRVLSGAEFLKNAWLKFASANVAGVFFSQKRAAGCSNDVTQTLDSRVCRTAARRHAAKSVAPLVKPGSNSVCLKRDNDVQKAKLPRRIANESMRRLQSISQRRLLSRPRLAGFSVCLYMPGNGCNPGNAAPCSGWRVAPVRRHSVGK